MSNAKEELKYVGISHQGINRWPFLLDREELPPAGNEAGLPEEPQEDEHDEQKQHHRLVEGHGSQVPVALLE